MAGKIKSAAKTAVKETKGIAKLTVENGGSGSCMDYVSLRNVMDGVQYAGLDYYSKGKNDAEKKIRANLLKAILMKAYDEIHRLPEAEAIRNCYPCDGVCLPYKCP